jgi:predicted glycoside hydrolase/deacetylase ChbG (UPF0249 family)
MPPEAPETPRHAPVRLTLCADDYAMHPAVDDAVIRLARAGRLVATSCMTTSPRWREAARALREEAPAALSTGLHLNLTEGHGVAPAPSLGATLRDAYARRLDPVRLRAQIERQLDDFERALDRAPDFIDGHQHVHQLPRVREALFAVLEARFRNAVPPSPAGTAVSATPTNAATPAVPAVPAMPAMPAVRATVPAQWRWSLGKAGVLALLGGWRLRRALARRGVPHNRGFAGVYGFDAATPADYGRHMERWLAGCSDGTLMMCHPATALVPGDAIAAQRVVEYAYLASDAFADSLRRHGVVLAAARL